MGTPFLWICRAKKLRTAPVQALGATPAAAAQTPKGIAAHSSALPPLLAVPWWWGANGQTPIHDRAPTCTLPCASGEQLAGNCLRNAACKGRERLSTAAASHLVTECGWMICSSTAQNTGLYLNVSPHFHVQAHGFIELSYSS